MAYPPDTYTRPVNFADKTERYAVIMLLVRAFATNGLLHWIAWVKRPGPAIPPTDTKSYKDLPQDARNLYFFYYGFLYATCATGGRAIIAVQPTDDTNPDHDDTTNTNPKERIVAVALWNRPGVDLDSISIMMKSKQWRTVTGGGFPNGKGWCLRGLYRALKVQSHFVTQHKKACKELGIVHRECWTCEIMASDPEFEGKGFAAYLIREGLAVLDALEPAPACLLEANSPRPKAIYERFGWKETSARVFGKGSIGQDGFKPSKSKSESTSTGVDEKESSESTTGITAWTMIRLPRGA